MKSSKKFKLKVKSKPKRESDPLKGREERWPTGWSYSAWGLFNKCMFMYYCCKILGFSEGTNQFLERGNALHKVAEQYLKGNVQGLPKPLDSFKSEYRGLKAASPIVEQFWGVNQRWEPTSYGSWLVMKMDGAVAPSRITDNRLFIYDLKTGREYKTHIEQGEVYGCIGLSLFPKADGVEAEFWYADQGYIIHHEFDRSHLKAAMRKWEERGKELLSKRKTWPASPSEGNCKWCFLRADKGGPCQNYHRGS